MLFLILLAALIFAVIWWAKGNRAVSLNEKVYLRQRGYDAGEDLRPAPRAGQEARLLNLLESLDDITPYARERAAEEIGLLCQSGQRDDRMFAPLVTALEDRSAAVRGAVALALGDLADPRAIEPLRRVVEIDDSSHARAQARRALQKLGAELVGDK